MLVLIDESGDSGFKEGSSAYLVFAMVVFDNLEKAEIAGKEIKNLQGILRVKPEFKFSGVKDSVKNEFFKRIVSLDFKVRYFYAQKSLIYSRDLRNNPKKFYNYCIKQMFKNDNGRLKNAAVKIDGSISRNLKQAFDAYIRKDLDKGKIKEIKFKDSKHDTLIQLADMVVGAAACPLNSKSKKTNLDYWRKMIDKKVEDNWFFK